MYLDGLGLFLVIFDHFFFTRLFWANLGQKKHFFLAISRKYDFLAKNLTI